MNQSNPSSNGSTSPDTDQSAPDVAQFTRETRDRIQKSYSDLEQTYDQTRARLEDFNEQAVTFIRENPALAILGAAAAGYIIGRLASKRWLT